MLVFRCNVYVDSSYIPIEKPNENDFEEYGNQKGLFSINKSENLYSKMDCKKCDYKH